LLEARCVVGGFAVILFFLGFWLLWKRALQVSFALILMAATLTPVLNAKWMGENVFAERYLYLPSVGFCWIMAWALRTSSGWQPAWRKSALVAMTVVGLLWVGRIVTRNLDWRDNLTLYTQTLTVSPDASLIRANL